VLINQVYEIYQKLINLVVAVKPGLMNLKPGLMQVFGRFLSINPFYIFCPNLHNPGLAKTRF
jgi:hypothetical protein